MIARDVMTPDVITAGPDTAVASIAKLLIEKRISAVPVIDAKGKIVGIVSEGDLVQREETGAEVARSWWLTLFESPDDSARAYAKSHGLKAADVMTRKVISVTEDTPLSEIATILEKNRIKRVPVVREGRPVGILSRANLIQALAATKDMATAPPSEDDRTIRAKLIAEIQNEPWANVSAMNIVVTDGEVNLWGMVDSENARSAVRIAAENVPGVKAVNDHMGTAPRAGVGYI